MDRSLSERRYTGLGCIMSLFEVKGTSSCGKLLDPKNLHSNLDSVNPQAIPGTAPRVELMLSCVWARNRGAGWV